MRIFTLIVSALFVVIGVWAITAGDREGWLVAGFFLGCLLVALFEPRLRRIGPSDPFRLIITEEGVACEHPRRRRESIRWDEVDRIWYVTTSEGPRLPDEWILLEGVAGGCSFPTEATGFDGIWEELRRRFAGFDYGPLIRGGDREARHL